MSPISTRGAMTRRLAMVLAVLASPVTSQALPQVAPATTAPRPRTGGRLLCVNCADTLRARHDTLLYRLDSLRTQWVTRRLTRDEQEALGKDIAATLESLRFYIEAGVRTQIEAGPRGRSFSFSVETPRPAQAPEARRPRSGWLGLNLDGPSYGYPPEVPDVIRFLKYPLIASVDPSSPAERAGLLRGDTLLSFNGTDVVENTITLSRLLVPNERLTLTVRRDGDDKEFRVIVGEAPTYVVRRFVPIPSRAVVAVTPAPPAPPNEVTVRTLPRPSVEVRVPAAPDTVVSARSVFIYSPYSGVAGARVTVIGENMARIVGSSEGVLVVEVAPGSQASRSGLRDGDVVLLAGGEVVNTPRQFSRIVSEADRGSALKLVILRDRKQQELYLRW